MIIKCLKMKVGVSEHAVPYINLQSVAQYSCSSSHCCILLVKQTNEQTNNIAILA